MKYRLGLDVGTNSLGWAVLELDQTGIAPIGLIDCGARIFQDGRQVKSQSTLKAVRTQARSSRRRLDRYKQRRRYLLQELIKHGLFPGDKEGQRKLQDLDPLQLRSAALDQKLELHEFGRAIFHLNQRRGFKSNRKDAESRSGVVRDSIEKMQADLAASGCRTIGEFLWRRRKDGGETRVRRSGTKVSDLYQFYPSRELLEGEFHAIWDAQARYRSEDLSDELREHFFEIVYFQRPLKPQAKGMCAYLDSELRCYRALPSFQRYRILQEVNNLEWSSPKGTFRLIEIPQARDLVLELMLKPKTKSGNVVFSKIAGVLKELDLVEGNFKFNLQSDMRKHLDGDQTAAEMQQPGMIGQQWHQWPLEKQDALIDILLDSKLSDLEALERLKSDFDLDDARAKAVLIAPIPDGVSNVSLRAARLIGDRMLDNYCIQSDAVIQLAQQHEEFNNPYKLASSDMLLDQLPYYGEYVRGHIIPGQGNEKDYQARVGMVSNPTVHIALNQIRVVVNEIIKRFGAPTSIAIELGRDLPAGEITRKKNDRIQKENQDRNERLKNQLKELGRSITHDNLVRMKLWEELGENPTDRRCVFTGKMIGIADLFNGNCEIEHLIPFSSSLDDSLANKTVCFRQANRDKGNRTAFDAFGDSPSDYDWTEIFERVKRLPHHKQWRFEKDALQKWTQEESDFLARHLNDTRYIGRLSREYLTAICKPSKVEVVTGKLTSLFRHHWGLNTVLNLSEDAKNRDDHRHHAIDAIVVGATTRSTLQKLHRAARKAEELGINSIVHSGEEVEPWEGFRDQVSNVVDQIIVSHKPTRHPQGRLHNDTAMGVLEGPDEKGKSLVVLRKPAASFTSKKHVEAIKDQRVREKLLMLMENMSIEKAFAELGIKSIRVTQSMKVIPIKDSTGAVYKAYKGDSNWAIEIYELPRGAKDAGKWVEVLVSTFEANQADQHAVNLRKPHPAAKLVMRLHRNDYLIIRNDMSEDVYRVQKLSSGMIALAPPSEANCDKRNRDKDAAFSYMYKSAGSLKILCARKADVSPTGLISTKG